MWGWSLLFVRIKGAGWITRLKQGPRIRPSSPTSSSATPQTEIETFGSALFWTSTQLLTVSSSIKDPISFGGRLLDVFMEAYAITVIAALAGAFGAFIQKRGSELDGKG